jgi:cystathionine beta-lyase
MPLYYDFDQPIDRRGSDSLKWNAYSPEVLPMWVADMDFLSPPAVIRALCERVEHGIFGYPLGLGSRPDALTELRQVLVERMAERYHWSIQPEDIVFIPGVVTGFNLACHAFATPLQAILVQTPVYPPILTSACETGHISQEMELSRASDGSYTVDWEAFEASLTPQTRLFILCNPHNPVGKVFTRDELSRMAEICLRHSVIICSDEIHCDLIYSGYRHTPIASLDPEVAHHTITLMAPSKTYNIAGLQCSFAIIPNREMRKRYIKSHQGLVSWVNLMGLVAAKAAYQEGSEWLVQLLDYLEGNRHYLVEHVRQYMPGVQVWAPEGTYLAWLDCRQAGIEGNPYRFFLEKGRVALGDGETFGRGGEGFVRLNFGCRRLTLQEGLERMCAALHVAHL